MAPSPSSTVRQVAIYILIVFVLESCLLAIWTLLGPTLWRFEPETAWLEPLSAGDVIEPQTINALSPDGSKTLQSKGNSVQVLDTQTGAALASLRFGASEAPIRWAAWRDDSTILLKAGDALYYAWRWRRSRLITPQRGVVAIAIGIPLAAAAALFFRLRRRDAT
jgi:hypothetical protein